MSFYSIFDFVFHSNINSQYGGHYAQSGGANFNFTFKNIDTGNKINIINDAIFSHDDFYNFIGQNIGNVNYQIYIIENGNQNIFSNSSLTFRFFYTDRQFLIEYTTRPLQASSSERQIIKNSKQVATPIGLSSTYPPSLGSSTILPPIGKSKII